MILTNKINFLKWIRTSYVEGKTSGTIDFSSIPLKSFGGYSVTTTNTFNSTYSSTIRAGLESARVLGASTTSVSIYVGSSGSPVSASDYTITDVKSVSGLTATMLDDGGVALTGSYTNGTGNDFTIREIGRSLDSAGSGGLASYSVLIERIVLDTPVTLHPGEVYAVKYKIKCDG